MSKLKCPFCQQEMICGGTICHYNPDCPIHDNPVPTEILELLDRTRKALEITTDAIDEILVLDSGKFCKEPAEMWKIAKSAKDKITALEQKDVK